MESATVAPRRPAPCDREGAQASCGGRVRCPDEHPGQDARTPEGVEGGAEADPPRPLEAGAPMGDSASPDRWAELQLEQEREHEELLYKRAMLEVTRELNKKCEEVVQEVASLAIKGAAEGGQEAGGARREAARAKGKAGSAATATIQGLPRKGKAAGAVAAKPN